MDYKKGMNSSVFYALIAAVLFGASTPFAKLMEGDVHPLVLAGLLYLSSGIGLAAIRLIRDQAWNPSGLIRQDWFWLLAAIIFGGLLGPVLLMSGLMRLSGSSAALLLNLEAVLTALIAWVVFRENADRRVILGMIAIIGGGVVLSWPDRGQTWEANWTGPLLLSAACCCWALDNNLTRKVSTADALFLAASKGLVAGTVNCGLALALGLSLPPPDKLLAIAALGLLGYGVSLALFILALRGLGTARAGAYFSTAPFIGAAVALVVLAEQPSANFWLAAGLMAIGVSLHLTERHEHSHTHETLLHRHPHRHDEHHQHAHDFDWDGKEPHVHVHRHAPITHTHPHYPDIHHQH